MTCTCPYIWSVRAIPTYKHCSLYTLYQLYDTLYSSIVLWLGDDIIDSRNNYVRMRNVSEYTWAE